MTAPSIPMREGVEITPWHIADYLWRVEKVRCNCDLDNWQTERSTHHTHVCRIHRLATAEPYDMRPGLLDAVRAYFTPAALTQEKDSPR